MPRMRSTSDALATGPGLSEVQLDARDDLARFVRDLADATTATAREPYIASEVAVYVRTAFPVDDIDGDVAPGIATWPLGDLAAFGSTLGANTE